MKRCFIILGLLFCLGVADVLEDKQRDASAIRDEIARQRQLLESVKSKEQDTLRNLFVINKTLGNISYDLRRTEKQLQENYQQLYVTRQEMNNIEREYTQRLNIIQQRIREIYKDQYLGYLSFLLSTSSFYDYLSSSYYFEKIVSSDLKNIAEIQQIHREYKLKDRILATKQSAIGELKANISIKKRLYSAKQQDQRKVYGALRTKRAEYEKRIAELERNSEEIEALIQLLNRQGALVGKGSGIFNWPIRGIITSPYGYRRHPIFRDVRFHTGIDIAQRYGTRILTADAGNVIFSGWWGGYGRAVIIDHGRGFATVYAHLSRAYVKKGDEVGRDKVIGLVGSTGYSTGPHLHFEIRKDGRTEDPMQYLK